MIQWQLATLLFYVGSPTDVLFLDDAFKMMLRSFDCHQYMRLLYLG